ISQPRLLEDARRRLSLAYRDPADPCSQSQVVHLQRGVLLAGFAGNRCPKAARGATGGLVLVARPSSRWFSLAVDGRVPARCKPGSHLFPNGSPVPAKALPALPSPGRDCSIRAPALSRTTPLGKGVCDRR